MLQIFYGALFFGSASAIGSVLGETYGTGVASPASRGLTKMHVAVPLCCAAAGAYMMARMPQTSQMVTMALLCLALTAIWRIDERLRLVPDIFSLGALALILLRALVFRDAAPFAGALFTALPFAAMAWYTKGRGLGWGDVKLAAVGGALLGAPVALFAFALASAIAGILAHLRGRKHESFAFAPYMICAVAAGALVTLA